jgi:hypothetical protein
MSGESGEIVIVSILPEKKFWKHLTIAAGAAAGTWPALSEADCEAEPPPLLYERFLPSIECCDLIAHLLAKMNLQQSSPRALSSAAR